MKVLITDTLHPIAKEILRREGVEVEERLLISKEELVEILPSFPAIITRSQTGVDRDVIDAGSQLKVIGRAAIGVDNIDLEYATSKGVLVVNVPSDNVVSAAEHTFALLLASIRNILPAAEKLKEGQWSRAEFEGLELEGKRLGIIGLGKVGSHVARIAHGFGMRILAYDPYIATEKFSRFHAERVPQLLDLIRNCDILTVHTPKTKETLGMLDYLNLKEMKPGGVVVNCARGGIIDEEALARLLDEGHIRGAGVDVFAKEPAPGHFLHQNPRCVCSPHLGASTEEAQFRVGRTIALQIVKALKGEVVDHPVNMPFVEKHIYSSMRPLCVLAEKIGKACRQLVSFNPAFGRMEVYGTDPEAQTSLLEAAFLKGFLENRSDERVNYINSIQIARQMGLRLDSSRSGTHDTYSQFLRFEIFGDGAPVRVAGTIFGKERPRIVELNGYSLEWDPEGIALVIRNMDKPGVIGRVGTLLGEHGINIARWELGRREQGGEAMAFITLDDAPDSKCLNHLKGLKDVLSAQVVNLN